MYVIITLRQRESHHQFITCDPESELINTSDTFCNEMRETVRQFVPIEIVEGDAAIQIVIFLQHSDRLAQESFPTSSVPRPF
jgi:hypothetical protein